MAQKLLISINSLNELDYPVDGYVLGYEKFTYFSSHNFTYEEIENIEDKSRIYILINALIHEKDLDDAITEINRLINLGVNFIIQDLGLVSYLKKINYQKDVIYFPYTLLANSEEINSYNALNIDTGISPYLNPQEYNDIKDYSRSLVLIYGYIPLYQTYREIISLYNEKYGENCGKSSVFLKENERNELMPILENRYGTIIFKSTPIDYIDKLHYFKNAKYLFIDTNLVEKETVKNLIKKIKNYEEN